jgi:GIY-YIG catalytic domain-containing protein
MDAEEAAALLRGESVTVETARRELPKEPGLYAWWTESLAIPKVPPSPHPDLKNLDLFYVGIAPRERSSATLRSRVCGQHIAGNTGSSTFRYVLAALLIDALDLHPFMRGKKFLLPAHENQLLSAWQQQHLWLSWAKREKPWEVEDAVLRIMEPPLNSKGNASHAFYPVVEAARRSFREKAKDVG